MRAYDARDGRIIWEFNTRRPFPTINGVEGKGGGINGPGPVIAGGILYVNSGYGAIGGIPGTCFSRLRPGEMCIRFRR